jgi:septal ring factor EnvC (AmiA/AmiB activator)
MTNVIHPEKDAPLERMDIHKDVVWVIRTLWGGALGLALAAMWVASLAADVEQNKERLENTVTTETASAIVSSLQRIESKIDAGDDRQREIQQDLAALKQKVSDIEEEVNEKD